MAAKLTDEQLQAIRKARGTGPVELVDPSTNKVYILMSSEGYERFRPFFEEDPFSKKEQTALLREAGKRAGWDDPAMDVYDAQDPRLHK